MKINILINDWQEESFEVNLNNAALPLLPESPELAVEVFSGNTEFVEAHGPVLEL